MTKTQKQKEINRLFFEYVEKHFPEYMENDEEGGRVNYMFDNNSDNSIEYQRSRFEIYYSDYACEKTKHDADLWEIQLKFIQKIVNS